MRKLSCYPSCKPSYKLAKMGSHLAIVRSVCVPPIWQVTHYLMKTTGCPLNAFCLIRNCQKYRFAYLKHTPNTLVCKRTKNSTSLTIDSEESVDGLRGDQGMLRNGQHHTLSFTVFMLTAEAVSVHSMWLFDADPEAALSPGLRQLDFNKK